MSEKFHRFFRHRVKRKMNKEVATRNLFDFADLLDSSKVPHFLAFGTLLGAVREGDFIEHDTDTDLATFAEHYPAVRKLCRSDVLASYGFSVPRERAELVSILRDGEHIDLYFFSNGGSEYRCMQYTIVQERLQHGFSQIEFLGRIFNTVKEPETDLRWRYGEDWQTPKRGFHATF